MCDFEIDLIYGCVPGYEAIGHTDIAVMGSCTRAWLD